MSDAPFAAYNFPNGTLVRNSEHEADGSFRRFVTTPKGIEVTLLNTVPAEIIGHLAEQFDFVADVNFEAGERKKLREVQDLLGIKR